MALDQSETKALVQNHAHANQRRMVGEKKMNEEIPVYGEPNETETPEESPAPKRGRKPKLTQEQIDEIQKLYQSEENLNSQDISDRLKIPRQLVHRYKPKELKNPTEAEDQEEEIIAGELNPKNQDRFNIITKTLKELFLKSERYGNELRKVRKELREAQGALAAAYKPDPRAQRVLEQMKK